MAVKDFYSILGIRVTAFKEEIDLAYRGRRTQYHPDKYAGSDQETLRWATVCMQDVNEAYATLSDVTRRQRYDQQRSASQEQTSGSHSHTQSDDTQSRSQSRSQSQSQASGSTHRDDTAREHAGDANTPNDLDGIGSDYGFQDYVTTCGIMDIDTSHLFFAPNIPMKKLQSAWRAYGQGLVLNEIVVLVDDTFFGSANEGALLTNDEMRIKEKLEPAKRISYDQIEQVSSSELVIVVNGMPWAECLLPEENQLSYLMSVLNEYLRCRNQQAPSLGCQPHPRLPSSVVHQLCQAYLELDSGKNANFFFGSTIPLIVLRTVHFSFSLQAHERLLAVMNLDVNTRNGNNAFVLTSLGMYSKCRGVSIFISWTQLAPLTVVGDYIESIYHGVVLSNRQRFLCSRIRPATPSATVTPVAAFIMSLIRVMQA
ncbi:J domain-containing protein [Undibacterium sp. Xuan67W]|uniref:J domain-containing protein n=1 Tax=Undibacterium sp. Xuan67W TaxID=3413057 RepID=UPI003BEF7D48